MRKLGEEAINLFRQFLSSGFHSNIPSGNITISSPVGIGRQRIAHLVHEIVSYLFLDIVL